jgi:hypothetical protein
MRVRCHSQTGVHDHYELAEKRQKTVPVALIQWRTVRVRRRQHAVQQGAPPSRCLGGPLCSSHDGWLLHCKVNDSIVYYVRTGKGQRKKLVGKSFKFQARYMHLPASINNYHDIDSLEQWSVALRTGFVSICSDCPCANTKRSFKVAIIIT